MIGMLFMLLSFIPGQLRAEGSREVAPSESDFTMLLTGREDFSDFAAFDGPADSRLYFRVLQEGELLFLGLSAEYDEAGNPFEDLEASAYRFRIRRMNPGGDDPTVHGPFQIDAGLANVSGWNDAVFGAYDTGLILPNPAKDNMEDFVFRFTADTPGDYYIEFEDADEDDGNPKVLIGYWDFTVVRGDQPVPGRVYSRNWAFRTPVEDGSQAPDCSWDRRFNAALYSYTSDGFVSRIDFMNSGFQGLAFTVAFNTSGPGDSGDIMADRRSRPAVNVTEEAAEHLIFLNEPDPEGFPDGECGALMAPEGFTCDDEGNYCFEVEVTRGGQVELILDFNKNGRYDPGTEDVMLGHSFFGSDELTTCIAWDGVKGNGETLTFGERADLIYIYTQGVQHWSVYDAEFLKEGFCVEAVRPICGSSLTNVLYWDDTLIPEDPGTGQPKSGLNGCVCRVDGCRSWNYFDPNQPCGPGLQDPPTEGYGDKSTLNTWWFAGLSKSTLADISFFSCKINADSEGEICYDLATTFTVEVSGASGTLEYEWSGPEGYEGSEEADSGPLSIPGEYCVTVTDENGCQTTCCRTLEVGEAIELECESEAVSCAGAEDGRIIAMASGGAGDFKFMVEDVGTNDEGIFEGLPAGSYSLAVIDKNGCAAVCEVTIEEPQAIECEVELLGAATCAGGEDGSARVTATGGTGDYSYEWDNGETEAEATVLSQGAHMVTVTDEAGCKAVCVIDVPGPEIELICPSDLEVECGDEDRMSQISRWLKKAEVINTCEEAFVMHDYNPENFTGACPQTQEVTFTFMKDDGSELSCSATIRIVDETAPELSCENLELEGCDPELPGIDELVELGKLEAFDACSEVEIELVSNSEIRIEGCRREQDFTYKAIDECGLESEACTLAISWISSVAPVCEIEEEPRPAGFCGEEIKVEDYRHLVWTDGDECGDLTVGQSPAPGTRVTLESPGLWLTFTVSNACGQRSICEVLLPCEEETPVDRFCTFTPGYWANHNEDPRKDPDVAGVLDGLEGTITIGPWTLDQACIDVLLPGPPQHHKGDALELHCHADGDPEIRKQDVNSMLRHAIALRLNMAVNPGLAETTLGELDCSVDIPEGLDAGSTVADLLELAGGAMPGFNSSINEAMTSINECYNDGDCREDRYDEEEGEEEEEESEDDGHPGKSKGKGMKNGFDKGKPKMRVLPNPAHTHAQVRVQAVSEGSAELRLLTLHGQVLQQQLHYLYAGSNELEIDVRTLPPGIYLILLQYEGEVFTQRLVKARR